MSDVIPRASSKFVWGWYAATAVLAIAVVIDVIDGDLLKLVTSILLLLACAAMAATSSPRTALVNTCISLAFVSALLLIVYRLFFVTP